ncbi:hypothetical protein LCGC14_0783150 [marine sediment metagenome]|uniref:Lipoprotein n=1 Tax=marine sediment metagenome TaxID=412755 RepID=A0A0F9T1U7_9ZZZZ
MKKLLIVLVVIGMLISGCTSAGPFVTDISSDGNGRLIITKNTVVYNSFLGVVTDGNKPIVYRIKVGPGREGRWRGL